MSIPLINYKVTLISGGKIIMVTPDGNEYEAQCFVPQILNGIITLVNVVRSRRCCLIAHNDSFLAHKKIAGTKEPLAKSTPAFHPYRTPLQSQNLTNNTLALTNISNECSIETPDIPRCAPGPIRRIHNFLQTPSMNAKFSSNASLENCSDRSLLPALPSFTMSPGAFSMTSALTDSSSFKGTPNVTFLKPKILNRGVQWRNCKTPVRTYSKKENDSATKPDEFQFHMSPKFKNGRSIPNYLRNGTKGIQAQEKVSVKVMKILVDQKTRISPNSYKQNIANTKDLQRNMEVEFIYSRNKKLFKGAQEKAMNLTLPWNNKCSKILKGQFEDILSNIIVPTKERYLVLMKDIPAFGAEEEPIFETKINEEVEIDMETNQVIIKRKNPVYKRRLF